MMPSVRRNLHSRTTRACTPPAGTHPHPAWGDGGHWSAKSGSCHAVYVCSWMCTRLRAALLAVVVFECGEMSSIHICKFAASFIRCAMVKQLDRRPRPCGCKPRSGHVSILDLWPLSKDSLVPLTAEPVGQWGLQVLRYGFPPPLRTT